MQQAIDQLHGTREAGRLLGGLNPRDVIRLIRAGLLRAKRQCVRGENKRPRLYVPASAIAEYIAALPDAAVEQPKRRTARSVRAELEGAKAYY